MSENERPIFWPIRGRSFFLSEPTGQPRTQRHFRRYHSLTHVTASLPLLPHPKRRALRQNSHPKIPTRAIRPPATRSATAQLPAASASSQRCPAPRVEWPLPECGQTPLPQYHSDSTNKDFF